MLACRMPDASLRARSSSKTSRNGPDPWGGCLAGESSLRTVELRLLFDMMFAADVVRWLRLFHGQSVNNETETEGSGRSGQVAEL
jgi:hypothetical protein